MNADPVSTPAAPPQVPAAVPAAPPWAARLAPALFVLLWSTGFIVARAIAGQADPCLFLVARFGLAALVLALCAVVARASWPRGRQALGHLAAGGLLHGLYLAASYRAVALGLSPGVMALICALQPPLTTLGAGLAFRERVGARLCGGMAAGLAGVALAVWPREGGLPPAPPAALWLAFGGMAAITCGALLQKTSLSRADLRSAGAVQHAGAAVVALILALAWGEGRFLPTPTVLSALAWSVAGLSVGGAGLLVWLMRRGAAAGATALLFLVPPLAALQAWLLFGARLDAVQGAGFGLALAGVILARGRGR